MIFLKVIASSLASNRSESGLAGLVLVVATVLALVSDGWALLLLDVVGGDFADKACAAEPAGMGRVRLGELLGLLGFGAWEDCWTLVCVFGGCPFIR